jgi:hypothetical protein
MLGARIAKVATAASLLVAPLFAGAVHAQVPVDVSNASVTCNTLVKASLKASPALVNGGTVPTTIKVKGVLAGCSSPDAAVGFPEFKSKFSGAISLSSNDCSGLIAPSVSSASITVKWNMVPKGAPNQSVITIDAGDLTGGLLTPGWGGVYAYLGLGVNPRPSGMPGTALAVSGAFTGGDGGVQSTADLVSQEDVALVFQLCSTTGVKALDLGIGQLHLE